MADIEITGGCGMYQLHSRTPAGEQWLADNVDAPGYAILGKSICVDDTRLAMAIADGALADGLVVS